MCGDGLVNVAAGEACDTIVDTPGCDSDCTLPVCGDGHVNLALEDCDDGNAIDDGNGCSSSCKLNNVCGNGHIENLVEQCDPGTGKDTASCDSDCTLPVCGDGHVNPFTGEQCDNGSLNGTGHCSTTCKLQ
jgi:cysteine-rich repeat protein